MGYYTRYELSWDAAKSKESKCPHCGGTGIRTCADDIQQTLEDEMPEALCSDGHKWYDHEEAMKAFSKRFPDVLFTLHGEGEESGDIWVKYFRDGKMQIAAAQIKMPDFDPKKLE